MMYHETVSIGTLLSPKSKNPEIGYQKQHNTMVKCIHFKYGVNFQLTMNALQKNEEIVRVVIFNSNLEISDHLQIGINNISRKAPDIQT